MWLPMRDKRVRPSAALVTLGIERIFDLAALVCFFSVNLLFFTAPPGREDEFAFVEFAGWAMIALVAAGFIGLNVYHRISDRVVDKAGVILDRKFIPAKLRKILISILKQLGSAVGILTDWREIARIVFWTILLWLSIAVPTWFVLLAFDLPLTFADALFIMGFAAIGSVVPTPGGAAGAFHTATAAGLLFLRPDMRTEDAAAVSIAMHLVYFVPAIVFGLYYFLHGDISIERFRSLLSSEHAVDEIESESPNSQSQPPNANSQVGTEVTK
jgi:uncharacterized protein (TIRG00374 family)